MSSNNCDISVFVRRKKYPESLQSHVSLIICKISGERIPSLTLSFIHLSIYPLYIMGKSMKLVINQTYNLGN